MIMERKKEVLKVNILQIKLGCLVLNSCLVLNFDWYFWIRCLVLKPERGVLSWKSLREVFPIFWNQLLEVYKLEELRYGCVEENCSPRFEMSLISWNMGKFSRFFDSIIELLNISDFTSIKFVLNGFLVITGTHCNTTHYLCPPISY